MTPCQQHDCRRKQDEAEPEELPETEMIGSSRGMVEIYKTVSQVAPTDATVLIEGETGTGKELIARMVHRFSARASQPFVPVDCASIAPSLLESELFGALRGAFTGSDKDRVGVFEAAGVPREQLVIGVPFYSRGFTGVPDIDNGLYQSFTGTTGADYRTIKREYLPTYRRSWHPEAGVPWLYDAASGTMMSYDDPESIGRKAEYAAAEGLGGVMIWELSDDDEDSSLLAAIASRLRA